MRTLFPFRTLALVGLMSLGAGCSTLSALSSASAALDAYSLSAPGAASTATASARTRLLVELPTAPGAIATDRILVRTDPLQVQYLPTARWIDPVPVLVQAAVLESLANSGAFRFVGASSASVVPDFVLLIDVRAFQAEVGPVEGAPVRVVIRMDTTLVRDLDREIVATRRIQSSASTADETTAGIVAAFDAATRSALIQLVEWTASVTSRRGGA
jgi:cholesterol transport system auxiliary component